MPPKREATTLIPHLKSVFLDLCHHPYPYVPSPPEINKRASVALIIRINPHYSHWPQPQDYLVKPQPSAHPTPADHAARIEEYLIKDWVQAGSPEVLFIKRASRKGDRWTGHVALPGGRRDPEDADDRAAAIRETEEEVGIVLNDTTCIPIGNLPQRLVTASWGTKPLMILCPYIFLLLAPPPPLRLQPTEVASAHWTSLSALLSPHMRTHESADVSSRLSNTQFGLYTHILRSLMGSMLFSAVKLVPSESIHCPSASGFGPVAPSLPYKNSLTSTVASALHATKKQFGIAAPHPSSTDQPLLLWGLTLGVLADFLELLPPHDALSLWTYPTFSAWDVRVAVWALSWRFRHAKAEKLAMKRAAADTEGVQHGMSAMAQIEVGMDSVPLPRGRRASMTIRMAEEAEPSLANHANKNENGDFTPESQGDKWLSRQEGADAEQGVKSPGSPPPEVGIAGLGAARRQRRSSRSSRVGFMLEGYYDIMRRAVLLALIGRAAAALAMVMYVWRWWKVRKSRKARL